MKLSKHNAVDTKSTGPPAKKDHSESLSTPKHPVLVLINSHTTFLTPHCRLTHSLTHSPTSLQFSMLSPEELILFQPGQWKSHKQKLKSKKKLAELS